MDIKDELKNLPARPGVYIMKDENGAIIYVGKAVNLRNRVRSYFREANPDVKVRSLAAKIAQFECIVTDSEVEALILECNLIKLHSPKYNIRLKDNKAYPYICLTQERFPRLIFAQQRDARGRFFGPYTSREQVRELLQLILDIWPLRRCRAKFPRDFGKMRPCLQHHLQRCKAPCNKFITEDAYNQMVEEAVQFVQGKTEPVTRRLNQEMAAYAEACEFEKAAERRDLLKAVAMLNEQQKADNTSDDDRDVIAMARNDAEALMQVFFVRGGKITGREHFVLRGTADRPVADIFAAFLKQFYGEAAFVPKELTLASQTAEAEAIAAWLSGRKGQRVYITVPQKGDKRRLVELAAQNAALTLAQFGERLKREKERDAKALTELAAALNLDTPPRRIEAYDISNIQGVESVGSMVVFEDGRPKNSDYRKFKIKGVRGPDDYASMAEVVSRRFARLAAADEKFAKRPDLLMIDGGKGQVNTALQVLADMGFAIPVCGMVKDERHRTRGLLYEGKELPLPRAGEGFKLIARIQDEVHRFALEYHRKLRADTQVRSVLDEIPGIGPARRKALMRHFKGIDPIRAATVEELEQAEAMNRKAAEAVYNFFRA